MANSDFRQILHLKKINIPQKLSGRPSFGEVASNDFLKGEKMRFSIIIAPLLIVAMVGCQGEYRIPSKADRNVHRFGYGVDGPGPGVVSGPNGSMMGGGMIGMGGMPMDCPPEIMGGYGLNGEMPGAAQTTQISFAGYGGFEGMQINWDVAIPRAFDSEPLFCPGTHAFQQNQIYRLKVSNIPGRDGLELYPTLEVAPATAHSQAYLQHCTVSVEFNDNDFDQVAAGNYVTKVIYLPRPEFQGFATAGVGTLVSTQLEPGKDPIKEAMNRGSILAIIRMGNKDLSLPGEESMMSGGQGFSYGGAFPQNYISGVNAPEYGKPMTRTTLGIPGPPSLPQAGPAPRSQTGIAYPVPQYGHDMMH